MSTRTQNRTRTKTLVEAALLVALATALSLFKLADLPYGGSVTLASMLPILLLSYRHGTLWGLGGGAVFALLQQLLGLSNLSYFTTWQSVLAVMLLDYFLAFTLVGLGGVFRRVVKKQSTALSLGALLVCALRYLCHVVAGATVWAGLSIPSGAALVYSLGYNATYMIPESIVLVAVCAYLGDVIDFSRERPSRMKREEQKGASRAILVVGLVTLSAVIVDALLVFTHVQHPETGAFDLSLLALPDAWRSVWLPALIVSAVATLVCVLALLGARRKK